MARSPFLPSLTKASRSIPTERLAFEQALDAVHMLLYPNPVDVAMVHTTRGAYLDALRPMTTRALHAAECLRVGGLDRFLVALPQITTKQVAMLLKRWSWLLPGNATVPTFAFLQALEATGKVDIARQTPTWVLRSQAAHETDPAFLTWLLDRAPMDVPRAPEDVHRLFASFPTKGWVQHRLWVGAVRQALRTPHALDQAAKAFAPGHHPSLGGYTPEALATILFLVPIDPSTRTATVASLQQAGWSGHAIARWGVDVVGM